MIYLDNASTTKPSKRALDAAMQAAEAFGNPSSLHRMGMGAEKLVKNAKQMVAAQLGTAPKSVYFTSGGTEANNTAIFGYVHAHKKEGTHIITTKIEHPSVMEPFRVLEAQGFDVTYLDVNSDGVVEIDALEDALRGDTVLVSVMHVNNETGMIQPIDRIKPVMKRQAPKAALHVDAVQSFCKIPCKMRQWGVDMLSVSGHKIHALKGIGALVLSEGVRISPILHGGGQQNGIRPGTENVVGIASLGAMANEITDMAYLSRLRMRLKQGLEAIEDIKINGSDEYAAGNILNVSFCGIKAEILLHALEANGIYVSTGSACSSNKPSPSHVLTAMGCTPREIDGAIRFSLDEAVTEEQIETVIETVRQEVATIRRYVRK